MEQLTQKLKDGRLTITEVPVPNINGLDDEILITLREIRDILKTTGRKNNP